MEDNNINYVESDKKGIDSYSPLARTITISTLQSREEKIFTILHELGHHLIYMSRKKKSRYLGIKMDDYFSNKVTKRIKLGVLTDEIMAWERGFSLGNKLNIKINQKAFDKVRVKSLGTYIKWAS